MERNELLKHVDDLKQVRSVNEMRVRLIEWVGADRLAAREIIQQLLSDDLATEVTVGVLQLIASEQIKISPSILRVLDAKAVSDELRCALLPALGFVLGPSAFRDIATYLSHENSEYVYAAIAGLKWFRPYALRRLEAMSGTADMRTAFENARDALRGHDQFDAEAESITPTASMAFFLKFPTGGDSRQIEIRGTGLWNVPGQNDPTDVQTFNADADEGEWLPATGFVFQSSEMYTFTTPHVSTTLVASVRGFNGEFTDSIGVDQVSNNVAILTNSDEIPVQGTLSLSFQHTQQTQNTFWIVTGEKARFLNQNGLEAENIGAFFAGVFSPVTLLGKTPTFLNEVIVRLSASVGFLVDIATKRFTVGSRFPNAATDDGLLLRLFVAATRLPGEPDYNEQQSRLVMQAIRAIVDNRLRNSPVRFGAPSATNSREIIVAPGQFPGFGGSAATPVVATTIQARVEELLSPSNVALTAECYQFYRNALQVIGEAVTDPFAQIVQADGVILEGKTYAWSRVGDPPLPLPYVAIPSSVGGIIGGIQFYGRRVPIPLDAFLEFRTYSAVTKQPEPLPAGMTVELVDHNPLLPNKVLQTNLTDQAGRVHFHFPDLQDLDEVNPDLFFMVRPSQQGPLGLPLEWSTRGWFATDGSPGFYPDYSGQAIGSSIQPLVFSLGVDIHLQVTYTDRSQATAVPNVAVPPRIVVDVVENLGSNSEPNLREISVLQTDVSGQVHGVFFAVSPEQTISIRIRFQTSDASIQLPLSTVSLPQASSFANTGWLTELDGSITTTSLGNAASPIPVATIATELDAAFYMVKILREFQTFFFAITGGAWTGISDLTISLTPLVGIPDAAFSWPIGRVNFPENSFFRRSTIIHELSHQVVWKQADFSSIGIGFEFVFGELTARHHTRMLSNEEHAFLEGWPEFIEAIFAGPASMMGSPCHAASFVPLDPFLPPNDNLFSSSKDSCQVLGQIGGPSLNQGQSVEGALAISLLRIYRRFVIDSADQGGNGQIAETATDGDVMANEPWLNNPQVQARFLQIVWQPLNDLAPLANPSSADLLANTKSRNLSTWHRLRQELYPLFVGMSQPQVAGITPATIPANTSQVLTITGDEFVVGMTVQVGTTNCTGISVTSSTNLNASSPSLAPGVYNITVITAAGTRTLSGALLVT